MSSMTTYRLANEADVDLSASLMDRIKKRASGSRWTCSGTSRCPIVRTPRRSCIRLVLRRKNSNKDATVSPKVRLSGFSPQGSFSVPS